MRCASGCVCIVVDLGGPWPEPLWLSQNSSTALAMTEVADSDCGSFLLPTGWWLSAWKWRFALVDLVSWSEGLRIKDPVKQLAGQVRSGAFGKCQM